jgi:tRNA threonylcarbamoyladenosine biosynthesis protein TsaE
MTVSMELPDADATESAGAMLAPWVLAQPGGLVFLEGGLGAGKTTLMRGLLRSLSVTGAIRSPTYTLIESYEAAGRKILHADLFRLSDPRELYALGLDDDPPGSAWWFVEWPERGRGVLPVPDVRLELVFGQTDGDTGRYLEIDASPEWLQKIGLWINAFGASA